MKKRDAYLDLDDYEVPPGTTVRTPMLLQDSRRFADHQPGYRGVTDAAVRSQRARWIKQMTDAWRTDARRKPPPDDDDDDDDDEPDINNDRLRRSAADARGAYYQMVQKLRDAWRMSPGVARAERSIVGAGPRSMVVERSGKTANGGEPDAATQLLRGPTPERRPAESHASIEARRTAQWNTYRANLENAWRGQTNPSAATAIEQQREKWLGK
jgi:hypothetical protein